MEVKTTKVYTHVLNVAVWGAAVLDRLRKAVSNESGGISRTERFIQVRLNRSWASGDRGEGE
jgi:hypothetical protein